MAETTTDHSEIRKWAESHGGQPACIAGTGGDGDPGMLRLMFPESEYAKDENLRPLDWETWFMAFDRNGLALVYDKNGRFNKIVARSTAEARKHGQSGASVHHPRGR